MATLLIGIAGPSGSGKTALARRLALATHAPLVSLDSYYRDLSHLQPEQRARTNFDEPASLEETLLFEQMRAMADGRAVAVPHYDFSTHTRVAGADLIQPGELVVVEGLLLLYWRELRDLLTVRVYVDLEDEACLARRAARDIRERGRTPECVQRQYDNVVRPMAEQYIWPTKRHADLVVRGDAPLEESVGRVLALVQRSTSGREPMAPTEPGAILEA